MSSENLADNDNDLQESDDENEENDPIELDAIEAHLVEHVNDQNGIDEDQNALDMMAEEQEEEEADDEEDGEEGERRLFLWDYEERMDSDDHDEDTVTEGRDVTYDKSLPGRHDYLGTDLEDVRGRVIHDDDTFITLPLLPLPGVVLMPGQTVPLHLFPNHTVAMIRNVRDRDNTLGVVTSFISRSHSEALARLGTTAEILAIKEEEDEAAGIANVKLKAIGRQRFEIKESRRQTDGTLQAKVRILPERLLPDPLEGAQLNSHRKLCVQDGANDDVTDSAAAAGDLSALLKAALTTERKPRHSKLRNANLTWWPPWVYRQYDADYIMGQVKEQLASWNITDKMPRDPVEFSYWVSSMLPLDDSVKLRLLSIDHATQRMRAVLSIMQRCSVLCCAQCSLYIANKEDVFSMTLEGPMAAYVNPGGHVHETLTIYKAQGLNLIDRPSTQNSWFPGYAWTIAQCRGCRRHMGWKFTAAKRGLKPDKFWGLTRSGLNPAMRETTEDDEDANWQPVM